MTDLLLVASVVLSVAALFRARLATFLFAANQVLILRSLQNIREFGQPISQAMLPAEIFAPERLEVANFVMLLPTIMLGLSILAPEVKREKPLSVPALPGWLFWAALVQPVVMVFSSRTILSAAYAAEERRVFDLALGGGLQVLSFGVLIYVAYRAVSLGRLSAGAAVGLVIALLIGTDYAKGGTGLATGIALCAAVVIHSHETARATRARKFIVALGALLLVAVVVRGVRATIAEEGVSAVSALADNMVAEEAGAAERGEGAEQIGNGSQYAAHLLECIDLYERGVSRNWRSIYAPVEYTFKPSFLVGPLGLVRSKEAAWELAEYFIHGGGIYLWGELYWNGGYLCVGLVGAVLIWFAFMCDTRFRLSLVWFVLLLQFAPGLLQGVGYGFAQVSRGIFNGLILLALVKVFGRHHVGAAADGGVGARVGSAARDSAENPVGGC